MKKFKKVCAFSLTFFCILFASSYAESTTESENLANANYTNSNEIYSEVEECNRTCGCDRIFKVDEATGECTLDYEYLRERTKATNEMHTERIRERNDRVFMGILYCALFILVCASICVISVCIFCYKIHISDQKLKNEVKALADKMNVEFHKKQSMKKKPRDPKEESCNVIVEDANIMCV